MDTDKHTKGEWSINNWPQARAEIVIGAPGTPRIAVIPINDVSINEQKANAAMIAAGPAMLKALRQSAQGWKNAIELGIIDPQHITSASILRDQAFAAIAKATEITNVV